MPSGVAIKEARSVREEETIPPRGRCGLPPGHQPDSVSIPYLDAADEAVEGNGVVEIVIAVVEVVAVEVETTLALDAAGQRPGRQGVEPGADVVAGRQSQVAAGALPADAQLEFQHRHHAL